MNAEIVTLRYSGPRFKDHGLSASDLTKVLRGYAGIVREVAKEMGVGSPAVEVLSITRRGHQYAIKLALSEDVEVSA